MTHTRVRAPHRKGSNKTPQFSNEQIAKWRPRIKAGLKMKDLAVELGIGRARLSEILSNDAYNV